MADNDELRALANSANPGPWKAINRGKTLEVWDDENYLVCRVEYFGKEDNAAFIAAANPKRVLELLTRIADLETKQ